MTDHGIKTTRELKEYWLAALRGLVRGFTYPGANWVAALLHGSWLGALAAVLEPLALSADEMQRAAEALPSDAKEALQALQVEYTYLFINAVPHVPAPPYASAYNGPGLLMSQAAEAAVRVYRQAGLTLAEDYHDLPDHLVAELGFVVWLGEQAVAAHRAGNEGRAQELLAQEAGFMRDQLDPWLPAFCQCVEDAARIPFYRELTRLVGPLLSVRPTLVPSR